MDVWIALQADNAERVVAVLREFGFENPTLSIKEGPPTLAIHPIYDGSCGLGVAVATEVFGAIVVFDTTLRV